MSTTHIVRPTIPDIFINQALGSSDAWETIHDERYWPESSVPSAEEYAEENDGDSIFPYGVWIPESRPQQIQFFLPKSYLGKMRQNFRVLSVNRYEGRFAEDDFNPAVDAMLNALTGAGMVEVTETIEGESGPEEVVVGYVDQSRFLGFVGHNGDVDGNVRTPERGIVIEVVFRGVRRPDS